MERSEVAAAGALAALEELDPPEGERNCTEPGSGRARPGLANADVVSYGKDVPGTVVGASGSFLERKSCQADDPWLLPNRACRAWSSWAERTSLPPPLPNMPPISEASAITSRRVQWVGSSPNAAYSEGILVGSSSAWSM